MGRKGGKGGAVTSSFAVTVASSIIACLSSSAVFRLRSLASISRKRTDEGFVLFPYSSSSGISSSPGLFGRRCGFRESVPPPPCEVLGKLYNQRAQCGALPGAVDRLLRYTCLHVLEGPDRLCACVRVALEGLWEHAARARPHSLRLEGAAVTARAAHGATIQAQLRTPPPSPPFLKLPLLTWGESARVRSQKMPPSLAACPCGTWVAEGEGGALGCLPKSTPLGREGRANYPLRLAS